LSTPEIKEDHKDSLAPRKRVQVWLNIYDLLLTNYTTSKVGLGVYHTGVVIYGVEYCYSGPQEGKMHLEVTGLRTTTPGDSSWIEDAIFKEPILIGYSKLTPFEVNGVYLEMCQEYQGPSYNVLYRNCNHFTRDFLIRILDEESLQARGHFRGEDVLPPYIDRITRVATKCRVCLPAMWTTDLRHQYEEEIKKHRGGRQGGEGLGDKDPGDKDPGTGESMVLERSERLTFRVETKMEHSQIIQERRKEREEGIGGKRRKERGGTGGGTGTGSPPTLKQQRGK